MYYPNNKAILETDDFDELRELIIRTVEGGTQEVTLTFSLNPRKHYMPNEKPDRLFLTEGANPRWMYVIPKSK